MNTRPTLKVNDKGHLEIGGCDTEELVARFPTPVYVFDEQYIRDMCAVYRETIENEYGGNGLVLYASKAFSCKAVYKIVADEKIGCDVVSGGELYTALQAGFPADKIYMHGNNKLRQELCEALDCKIGADRRGRIFRIGYARRNGGRARHGAGYPHPRQSGRGSAYPSLYPDRQDGQQIRVFHIRRHGGKNNRIRAAKEKPAPDGISLPHRFADIRKAVVHARRR